MFGGAKKWCDRKIARKPCRACGAEFQPVSGGNLYCPGCCHQRSRNVHAAGQRAWRAKNPRRHAIAKANFDLKRFGMTIGDYELMFATQGGACAICGTTTPGGRGKTRTLAVDHCHKTGRVRALLCHRCNGALGMVGDDQTILEKMIAYLGGVSRE